MNWKRLIVRPALGTMTALSCVALSCVAVSGVAVSLAAPAGAATQLTWNLAQDMSQDYVDNPIADSYGHAEVWSYENGQPGGETSLYTLLDNYTNVTNCHAAIHSGSSGYPAVGYHYGTSTEKCGTPTYPAESVLMHPADGSSAVVRWTSPITGTVELSADLTDEDATGGDGFSYQLSDDNGSDDGDGEVDNGGDSGPISYTTSVTAGQSLYVEVGARTDYTYDTTKLALTITGTPSTPTSTVTLGTHVADGKQNGAGATKVTLKVTQRARIGDPSPTGVVTADDFTCRPIHDTTAPGKPTKAQATCVGFFPTGSYSSGVHYSGDGTFAAADTTVGFDVS